MVGFSLFLLMIISCAEAGGKVDAIGVSLERDKVRATHIQELRVAIDARRKDCGLSGFSWSDNALLPKKTKIRATHVEELREALNEALQASGAPIVNFSMKLLPHKIKIQKEPLNEIKNLLEGFSCSLPLAAVPVGRGSTPSAVVPKPCVAIGSVNWGGRDKCYAKTVGSPAGGPWGTRFTAVIESGTKLGQPGCILGSIKTFECVGSSNGEGQWVEIPNP